MHTKKAILNKFNQFFSINIWKYECFLTFMLFDSWKSGLLQIVVREFHQPSDAVADAHQQSISSVRYLFDHGGEHRSTGDRAQTSEAHAGQSSTSQDIHLVGKSLDSLLDSGKSWRIADYQSGRERFPSRYCCLEGEWCDQIGETESSSWTVPLIEDSTDIWCTQGSDLSCLQIRHEVLWRAVNHNFTWALGRLLLGHRQHLRDEIQRNR